MASIATEINSGDNGSQTQAHPSSEECRLIFVKMTENAFAPTKSSKYAAGFDLMSAYDIVVPKRGSALIKTDIQIQLPRGTYGRIAPRSGLPLKNKIDVGAGVVCEDYRENIGVILFNHSDENFNVAKGDRIAQFICSPIVYLNVIVVDSLENTVRSGAGFGSTGVVAAKKPKLDVDTTPNETEKNVLSPTKKLNTRRCGVLSPGKMTLKFDGQPDMELLEPHVEFTSIEEVLADYQRMIAKINNSDV